MKKSEKMHIVKPILILLFIGIIFQSSQAEETEFKQDKAVVEKQADKDYYCPMHPAIVSSKPGKCPKCDMMLQKKDSDSQSPLIALLNEPFHEKEMHGKKVQVWVLTSDERKTIVNKFRESATDSIIKNRLSDSAFMNMMLKGTHHLVVRIVDLEGKETGDVVQVQITTPSKKKISNILNAMLEYFEASFTLDEKGTHKINVLITINGKTRETHFKYDVD